MPSKPRATAPIVLLLLLNLLRCPGEAWSQSPGTPPSDKTLSERVEEYMAARVARDRFSGSVLIARDGKVLFSRGYGMANLEHDVPNSPETKFRLGSITKQFTATAILILQERGKLNVQDRISKYLPDAPKTWADITIHHLLTHTSGIPNYTGFPEFLKTLPMPVSLKELIGRFRDKPLDFKPGEQHRYSNSGYVVLGQIIETVSGQNYAAFLGETIFGPLGMKDTGFDRGIPILKHRASGYTRRLGIVLTNCDYVDMSIPHAAGSLYSTVDDLLKWDRALYGEALLTNKSREVMFTPYKDNYGYGWVIDHKFGKLRELHGGGIMGFVTIIERYPEEKLLVVALCNLENSPVGAVGTDLSAIALGKKYVVPREPAAVKLDSSALNACLGSYQIEKASPAEKQAKESGIMIISRDGDRLFGQTGGKTRYLLVPESDSLFYLRAADSEVRFIKDPKSGQVTHLTLIRDGEEVRARKLPAGTESKDRK